MDLKQAFYKQKEELNQLKRDYSKLEKKLIKVIKENAADERVQELLKKIQGLNNKIAEVTGIMNRYKALYEQKQKIIEQQETIIYDLQDQVRDLRWQLDCLNDTRSTDGLTAAEEAKARETEEELDRERGKSVWDKFREKHHVRVPKKRYRNYYAKKRFADWFVEKMLFPLGCVLFAVVVFAILIHFDLIWYMW